MRESESHSQHPIWQLTTMCNSLAKDLLLLASKDTCTQRHKIRKKRNLHKTTKPQINNKNKETWKRKSLKAGRRIGLKSWSRLIRACISIFPLAKSNTGQMAQQLGALVVFRRTDFSFQHSCYIA